MVLDDSSCHIWGYHYPKPVSSQFKNTNVDNVSTILNICCVPMLLLLAITRYTNNCITVHRLHSDYEALPLRVNKHIVQFHSTVFIIIDISTLDTTSGDEVPTNTSCRSPAYEMSLPQFPAFSLSEGNLNLGPRWAKWLSRFNRLMVAMEIADPPRKQALLLHYAGPEIDEIYDT